MPKAARRRLTFAMVVAILPCAAGHAAGQVVTTSEHLVRTTVTCRGADCDSPVATLSKHLTHGDMVRLQGYAAELLHTLARSAPDELKHALGDVNRNYYRLVWLCRDDSGAASLQSVIVHAGDTAAIRTLPGITIGSSVQLLEILITTDPTAVLDTQYLSTRTKDPLEAQIAPFVEKTGIVGFLAALPLARGEAVRPEGAAVSTTYAVSRPVLPFARADLKIQDTLIVPGSTAGLLKSSDDLARRLSARDVRLSSCGRGLAAADAAAIAKGLDGAACKPTNTSATAGLTASEAATCKASLTDVIEEAFAHAGDCRDSPAAPGTDPVLLVDKQFTDLLANLRESRRAAEWKVSNVPRTRYSFGVLSSAIIGRPHYAHGTTRVKIGGNGAIVLDPMPTVLTMALVNIHPRAYDPQADSPTWNERFRLFVGTAITPDFGLGGGAGVMILRGLTADAGWTNLFVRTPRSGFSLGQVPSATSTPLSVGSAGVWFAGLSYSFK